MVTGVFIRQIKILNFNYETLYLKYRNFKQNKSEQDEIKKAIKEENFTTWDL